MRPVLETLEAAGGIYVAMFGFAVISGVFPLVNSELALIGLTLSIGSLPKMLVLAVIVACGQTISHSSLFFTARGITKVTTEGREKWHARIARARQIVEKWGERWLLLLGAAAIFGLPPMMIVSVAAGALGVRFRTFLGIGLLGRIVRFVTIVLGAHYI